ncbi:MAG: hypothetical protein WC378_01430 [Opitutaceae bacterium]|jgi:hypothetical protein
MLPYQTIRSALDAQPLFEAKTWQLSPEAWPLTAAQVANLHEIGAACLEFHQALETLYLRSASGKNLLRNKPLMAPWVAEYLDRGKPRELVIHARDPKNRGAFPSVLRPDLLLTDEGFVMTELDSVPGGIGLTAFLNRLYSEPGSNILGAGDAMISGFHESLAALRTAERNPLIALIVSDEAATYRPEMEWLAQQLQLLGKRVFCLRPDQIFPLGDALFFDLEGNPEKIEILYRFFELFDLSSIRVAPFIFEAWKAGEVAIAPPMRHFQEEKLALALFHHHRLREFWSEHLNGHSLSLLQKLIPASWALDASPVPPGAVLDGPTLGGRPLSDWKELAHASQKERDLIIKISGYHETAWGARSVVLGSDCSREEWQFGLEKALQLAPSHLHVLQSYKKPKRAQHPLYKTPASGTGAATVNASLREGRLRLCPYYFVAGGQAKLSGALATFCPPDKKIIHGMQDAALLPCRVLQS